MDNDKVTFKTATAIQVGTIIKSFGLMPADRDGHPLDTLKETSEVGVLYRPKLPPTEHEGFFRRFMNRLLPPSLPRYEFLGVIEISPEGVWSFETYGTARRNEVMDLAYKLADAFCVTVHVIAVDQATRYPRKELEPWG